MMKNEKQKYDHGILRMATYGFLFCILGIVINIAGAQFASRLGLPLYLDSIGTVMIAVIGGYLPGVITGFLSNVINALSDPINAYYSFTNVLIAVAAAYFADRGYYKSFFKTILTAFPLALIGGGIGSVLTYCLYGFDIGQGFTAALSRQFFESGHLSLFLSQLSSDMLYDVADKLITVTVVFFLVKLLSSKVNDLMHFHGWRQKPLSDSERERTIHALRNSTKSLRTKLMGMVSAILVTIFGVTAGIAYRLYQTATMDDHIQMGTGAAKLVASVVPGDRVETFLEQGKRAEGYSEIERHLKEIKGTSADILYVYVYSIREDGCHVVFDLDTEDTPGSSPGDIIEFDDAFLPYLKDLLAGRPIAPIESNETFGWLMTMYEPIYDSAGKCAAYACVDISMNKIRLHEISFIAKVSSLFIAFLMVILVFGLWLADYNLVLPINSMAVAADNFANRLGENTEESASNFKALDIHTGDEIQNLYSSFSKTIAETVNYIADIQEKSEALNKMQNGLILVLADIVESRDKCTGDHVRKTAAYCRLILEELQKEGKFKEIINDDYINDVFNSAPLHDIGKINVPDAILNKPGKLTDEEYEVMKTHTTAGESIIQQAIELVATDAGYLREAKNLAAYHHEKWDGSGYPHGLKGDQIPLSARVMAVADVYDALVSRRSYKPPFDFDKAFRIIEEGAGHHFDPDCAAAFLKKRSEAEAIAEEFNDLSTGMITREAIRNVIKEREERSTETA